MLDLERLSAGELSSIGRQALEECGRRFRQIAEAADPSDLALQGLLRDMALGAMLQIGVMPEAQGRWPFGSGELMTLKGVREIIRETIPFLTRSLGEGRLHRDNALFYAESLQEETSEFFRILADHAREADARCLFEDLSDRERGKLRFLREVVLQS